MQRRAVAMVGSLLVVLAFCLAGLMPQRIAQGQQPSDPNQVAAKVERVPLLLTSPDRYRVPSLLEPLRRVQIMAPSDGMLKSLPLPLGSTAREGQEVGQMDQAEALARSKIALAVVKERTAEVDVSKEGLGRGERSKLEAIGAEARLDAAKGEAELAQIALDRCFLRAPFAGRILSAPVSAGQYLPKGTPILELADVSQLKTLIPVDRTTVKVGSKLTVNIEGKGVSAVVQSILPLDESRGALRELAAPLASAWVVVANADNSLEPGQRVISPYLPTAPIAPVASYAIKEDDQGNPYVQVIRAERVTDVKVRVVGALGPDRSQVSGLFRPSDMLVQSSSVPLLAGTFIRFGDAPPPGAVEAVPPSPELYGEPAAVGGSRIAPIGSPEAGTAPRKGASGKSTTKPATKGVVPF